MRIKKLLKDLDIKVHGNRDLEINGLSSDSRLVAPGNLFVAKKGLTVDGFRFIPEAISAGAIAILSDYYDPSLKGITQLVHTDVTKIEALLSARYYNHPSNELYTVGITGTNGKTTTAWMVKEILKSSGTLCGMIGTLGYYVGNQVYDATHTTPDVTRNHRLLREMCRNGCQTAIFEATSHALDQGRLDQVAFNTAIFTNLTHDHLDYHGDFSRYCAAKRRLFENLSKKETLAIVNGDDPYHNEMLKGCKANSLSFGFGDQCDLRASDLLFSSDHTLFTVHWKTQIARVNSPFLGKHNIYNLLGAIGVALDYGIPLQDAATAITTLPQVPGRMERLHTSLPFSVIVDFAHTPDALEVATHTLKELTQGRVITLFGCGGDRDKTKRPLMACTAEKNSTFCIVTSDNPRSENPKLICEEICSGFKEPSKHHCILDRKEAIATALNLAQSGDTVLIAGRGHESTQLIGRQRIAFKDSEVALSLIEQHKNAGIFS